MELDGYNDQRNSEDLLSEFYVTDLVILCIHDNYGVVLKLAELKIYQQRTKKEIKMHTENTLTSYS